MALAPAPVLACSPEARAELVAIVSRAFGIADGYRELNGAISGAAGFDMFDRIGMDGSPMRLIVAELAKAVEGDGTAPACLRTLFVAYPGNSELRGWVAANNPALLALVGDAAFEAARAGYEKDRQERRVRIIAANLTAIGPQIRLDAAQQAVSRRMIAQLEELNAYKSIHEILHGLQATVLAELDRIAGPNIEPDARRDSISSQLDELELARNQIVTLRDEYAALAQEPASCEIIVQKLDEVWNALKTSDQSLDRTARRAFMDLRAMLRVQMGQFDGLIVKTSKAIPFEELARILRELAAPDSGPAPLKAVADQLLATAEALDATSRRLAARREIHQLWQRMDAILHNVEELLWGSGRSLELEIHWEDIDELIVQLHAINPQDLIDVIAFAQPIEVAAGTGFAEMSDGLKRAFMKFIRKVRGRFQIADAALLRDCKELKRLHAPLEKLLENQG